MADFDSYEDDGYEDTVKDTELDLNKEMTNYYATAKVYGRKRISPTAMGNCEKKMVLMTIPQPNEWAVWGEVYARSGNALEDFMAGYYDNGKSIDEIVKSYMAEIIPHIFDDDLGVQKIVFEATKAMIVGYMQKSFGVGKLITQDNLINIKSMRAYSKADLFLDINGKFVIGEVKSLGDMPFDASPYKEYDNLDRLQAVYDKKYAQLMQLMFYTSIMGCDGQMVYVSRNSQKGNGSRNHPKYWNGANVPVPFNEDEALKILQRIYFAKISMEGIMRDGKLTKFIPQTPEHMKPQVSEKTGKQLKTSAKCSSAFCKFHDHCHKDKSLDLDLSGFEFMKDETAEALWAKCLEFAIEELKPKRLKQNRLTIFEGMRKKGSKMSNEEFLNMFDYKGYED